MVVACSELAGISDSSSKAPSPSAAKDDSGTSPPVTGDDRDDASITITPAAGDIDFGELPCGVESAAKVISIQNLGATETSYKLVIPDDTAFRIEGALEGKVAARGQVQLKVYAKPAVAGESSTDLILSAGDAVQSMRPKARGAGPTFELNPSMLNFGDVRMQSGASVDIEAINNGTAPALLTAFAGTVDFTVSAASTPLTIAPGGGKSFLKVTLTTANVESAPLTAMLTPTLGTGICGLPPKLTLLGRRVNSNVTLSNGDWAKQNCTAQNNKDIVVSNYSATALTFTATLPATSAFTILSGGGPGNIAAGSPASPTTQVIKLQPKPFGSNVVVIQEDLSIMLGGLAPPEGGLRKVPLKVDVRGAVVTFNPTTITDFLSDGTTTSTKNITATNTGNERIYLVWNINRTQGGLAWTGAPPSSIGAGNNQTGSASFKPAPASTDTAHAATLTPTRSTDFFGQGAVSCTPLTSITLKGAKTGDAGM